MLSGQLAGALLTDKRVAPHSTAGSRSSRAGAPVRHEEAHDAVRHNRGEVDEQAPVVAHDARVRTHVEFRADGQLIRPAGDDERAEAVARERHREGGDNHWVEGEELWVQLQRGESPAATRTGHRRHAIGVSQALAPPRQSFQQGVSREIQ